MVTSMQGSASVPALRVRDLVKRYGALTAVNGISFDVQAGEIFGLLGPNGAGKTTTLEIIEGLRKPDSGEVIVCGIDAVKSPRAVREAIGVQLQDAGLFELLTVRETLATFAAFHRKARSVDELIDALNLREKAKARVESLSGGQRQRLSIALALLNDPKVVFLDEPTTGLDPQARRNLWEVIAAIRGQGKTVVLTTHYMDEAEQLCDRVAIVDHGEVIAIDTPDGLIKEHASGVRIVIETSRDASWLGDLPSVQRVEAKDDGVVLHSDSPQSTLSALFQTESDPGFASLKVESGTLEDVFINLTGRRLRE